MGKRPSNEEITKLILTIADRFAAKFRFGYYDIDDMRQQCCQFALEGLEKYEDGRGPLENFLTVHVRNQLINFKRDNYVRPHPPCVGCPFHDPKKEVSDNECSEFTVDRMDCSKFAAWSKRNQMKKDLMSPRNIEDFPRNVTVQGEDSGTKELFDIINYSMPVAMRSDFNKMLEGMSVPKYRREKIIEIAKEIIDKHGQSKKAE